MPKAGSRRDRRAATPVQARHFLDAMRGLFRWAAKAKMVKADPTLGIDNPPHRHGDGSPPWTEEHVVAYQARWPIGTRQTRLARRAAVHWLRRGDAVRFGRQHVKDGIGTIKTEKSGFTLTVTIPILPILAETLTAGRAVT
ncbi:MAG: hypothetical protein WCF35_04255 [Pseudolabrys sp.]